MRDRKRPFVAKTATNLSVATDASHEPPEGDDLLLGDDVLQVGHGAVQGHLLDGLGRLAGVLQRESEIEDASHLPE